MARYFAYSSLLHFLLATALIVPAYLIRSHSLTRYYEIDFVGGITAGGVPGAKAAERAVSAAPAVPAVREDFLTKKAGKKEKPVIKSVPAPQAGEKAIQNAKAGAGQGDVGIAHGIAGAGGPGGAAFPYGWYIRTLRERLLVHWNEIKNLGQDKTCMVMFSISKDGSLRSSSIEKTSNDTYFDRMALRAVSYAEPFPPLPGDFREDELKVHVEFKVAQ